MDRRAQRLIGKPGLPTPQGEVRWLIGSRRPSRMVPARPSGVGVSRAPLEYFRCPSQASLGQRTLVHQWALSYLAAECGRSADQAAC